MYTVAVKLEGLEKRRNTTGAVHAIMGFFLLLKCVDLYRLLGDRSVTPVMLFAAVGVVSVLYGFFRRRIDPRAQHNAGLRLLQAVAFFSFALVMYRLGTGWQNASLAVWGLLAVVLYFSDRKLFQPTVLVMTEAGIRVPGTYREHLVGWDVLESVAVRHDFITLFHRGKKYLQYQVAQDLSELEVVKMDAFCRERIDAATVQPNAN